MDLLLVIIASYFIISKTKLEWALVIILALGTSLFQANKFFENSYLIPNMYDGALALSILLFARFYSRKIKNTESYNQIKKTLFAFLAFVLITFIIDIVMNSISISSILKTSRHWIIMLLMFLTIPKLPAETLYKALNITLKITLVISVIIVVEHLAETSYFTKVEYDIFGKKRGALPSTFAMFYALLVYTDYFKLSKVKKYTYLIILVASLLVSSTRSIALGILLAFIICIYFQSKDKFSSMFKIVLFAIAVYAISFALPTLNKRFTEAIAEVTATQKGSKDIEGNMTFRLYILAERYEYLKNNPIHYLFGIGNVVENDFKDVFNIGLYNEDSEIIQLDTGDISWPLILLRLGMLGLLIYLIWSFKFISIISKYKKDPLALSTMAYIITTIFIVSFASSNFARGTFWMMPTICLWLIIQRSQEKNLFIKNGNNNDCNSNL